jgi:hypothetical protein
MPLDSCRIDFTLSSKGIRLSLIFDIPSLSLHNKLY